MRALRCQLPLANPFYAPHPPGKRDLLPPRLPPEALEAARRRDPWGAADAERDPSTWPAAQRSSGGGGSGGSSCGGRGATAAAGTASGQQTRQRPAQQPAQPASKRPRLYPEAELVVEAEEEAEEARGGKGGAGGGGGGGQEERVRQLLAQYGMRSAEVGLLLTSGLSGYLADVCPLCLPWEPRVVCGGRQSAAATLTPPCAPPKLFHALLPTQTVPHSPPTHPCPAGV